MLNFWHSGLCLPTSQISTLKNYLYCFYFVFFLSLFLSVSLTSLQFCTFFFFVSLSCSLFLYPRSTADREMKAPSLTSSEAGQTITLCVSPPAKNYALQITAFQPHSSIHFFLSILFKHFVTACVVNTSQSWSTWCIFVVLVWLPRLIRRYIPYNWLLACYSSFPKRGLFVFVCFPFMYMWISSSHVCHYQWQPSQAYYQARVGLQMWWLCTGSWFSVCIDLVVRLVQCYLREALIHLFSDFEMRPVSRLV